MLQKSNKKIGVVLTKRPSSPVIVEVSISEKLNLEVLNPKIIFMPENWNIPQEVRLGGCAPAETSLTIRAKANLQGGFKETEKDELNVLISQLKNCGNEPKGSLARLKHEPSQRNSFSESSLIEFESPFFMILRAFLQPFFFAFGMANALHAQHHFTSTTKARGHHTISANK